MSRFCPIYVFRCRRGPADVCGPGSKRRNLENDAAVTIATVANVTAERALRDIRSEDAERTTGGKSRPLAAPAYATLPATEIDSFTVHAGAVPHQKSSFVQSSATASSSASSSPTNERAEPGS